MRYKTSTNSIYIPGTETLKNKLGITDRQELEKKELLHSVLCSKDLPDGDFGLKHYTAIHQQLFKDVYEWAGQPRSLPLSKGISRFCQPQFIEQEMNKLLKTNKPTTLKKMNHPEFVDHMTDLISEINAIHVFMEGNGRTLRAYTKQLCNASGYSFHGEKLKGETWNKASEQAFFGNTRLLKNILLKNIEKQPEKNKDKAISR